MQQSGHVILGAGMAGFGAANAYHDEGIRPRLFEARANPGGLTSSHVHPDGFVFDEGVHISFTTNARVKELLSKSVGDKVNVGQVYCNNYWHGHWVKHPAQVNLHGLPTALVVDCIKDFVAAREVENPVIRNYEDWVLASFGRTFAEKFTFPYTEKYHTTSARNLTTDWLGPRLYRPKLEEVLHGALASEPLDVFYVNEFRYPLEGGFFSFLDHFLPMADVAGGHEVVAIDPKAKSLRFANGATASYLTLVSSIPLPALVPLIAGAPADVREAAGRLACTQAVVVNIGIDRPTGVRPQWSYFYDEDICFARVSYRDNLSPRAVPAGCGAFQAETYFSPKYKPLEGRPEDLIEPTIDGLIKCGLVCDRSEIIHRSVTFVPYGNVIYDHDRGPALALVHGYLDEVGIGYCGRFGDWGYIWTDHAFMSGERAAKASLARVSAAA
jgi:protoporphyrinogen oxidase